MSHFPRKLGAGALSWRRKRGEERKEAVLGGENEGGEERGLHLERLELESQPLQPTEGTARCFRVTLGPKLLG